MSRANTIPPMMSRMVDMVRERDVVVAVAAAATGMSGMGTTSGVTGGRNGDGYHCMGA